MGQFHEDIFKEDLDEGKYSSKKVMGIVAGVLVCVAFIGDGFHWFTVNERLFDSMLIFSGAMLGVSTFKAFSNKSKSQK